MIGACLAAYPQSDRETRLRALRDEIARLDRELQQLETEEGGVLGELDRISAELSLGRTRLREVALRADALGERIGEHEKTLAELGVAQSERRAYLAFRLRELYKGGSRQTLRRWLGDRDRRTYWRGLRYASFLSARDESVLAGYRQAADRVSAEKAGLESQREALEATRRETAATNRRLDAGRRRQQELLGEIRRDAARRETAIAELREASRGLAGLIEGLDPATTDAALDMTKFQGLLDWPAAGEVRSRFGTVIHPRFKTQVPHPGIDILARAGDPIRSVFEGEVVFAGWLRGYGLTTIVDHGGGLHSVYAHAAVTWADAGERVGRGQRLGIVGETGSFSGPSLYFELRLNGKAVDPEDWLRPN
ncbi:MAG: peptidoglycan DD-metalloendopeptidase family protein [Acidobacteria bacterium]|nr:peptidoglycan DD-metalloendopeptidase family protein [Acidobacteriota bacterium]NIM61013.1 peptidoglycan DD-metalloendopeptidase family protein [Acidobacteriota bacterium]NIO59981.1 peptidoglycan DD-metalloendopeptidase family protein [Acidobacteriota bacterium]NIQ31053.1 peptidoglycan DD-metalloendopeptidase family protein [Acidobacteriota bacterium]NIQ86181.1 peptidoglycan DD-metalloendopeptidase family protein [Acidobacteriota bacterium]